jgi:cyclopropane fatty-acyl-phospholipid synthase-like methyltransferase
MNSAEEKDVGALSPEAIQKVAPGMDHYTAFVGPPEQYDFMGATQFRLLTTLGLREHNSLLDFGCGSLRAGRLFIPYLLPGRYYGLDPNRWLVDTAIAEQIGRSMVEIKRPTFLYHSDFSATRFGVTFDYILAQSIFSHSGRDIIARSFGEFKMCLGPSALVLATFIHPHQLNGTAEFEGTGWIYPGVVTYRSETILALAQEAGFAGRILPWFHPRQTWFALAHSANQLPPPGADIHLSGAVLRAPELFPKMNEQG